MFGTCQFCDANEDNQPLHEVCETCCHAIAAVSRLSPVVRELLLTNPEAVEKCVEAIKKQKGFHHRYEDVKSALVATDAAIAALEPKREG